MGAFWGSVRSVLPNVVEVIKRFPVPVLMALILTGWLLYGVYWKIDVYFITFALLTLFFASVGACLFTQHRKFEPINQILLSLGVCAFFASVYFLPDDMHLTTFMMPVALVLLASTIAFVGSEQENRSYWLFNHGFWFALIVAVLGGLLIAGLISMLMAAYALLFDVVVKSRAHQYSLIICLFLIAPLIWLSLLPQSFTQKVVEGEPEEFTAKITSLFVKYVFVPFFFLFALLFHALAIKVLIDGSLPTGQIGWYGIALVTSGIITYLLAFPTRNTGGPLVVFFTQYWMWCLLVPLGLMVVAYLLRLDQYGMTPLRFFLGGFLLWAIVLVVYGAVMKWTNRVFDLRIIVLLGAQIIGLASVGPWGAEAVANKWQKQRLSADLTKLGMLQEGKIVRPLQPPKEDEIGLVNRINGTLNYFKTRYRGETLRSLLSANALTELDEKRQDGKRYKGRKNRVLLAVQNQLGQVNSAQITDNKVHSYQIAKPLVLQVPEKGTLWGPFLYHFRANSYQGAKTIYKVSLNGGKQPINIRAENDQLVITQENGHQTLFELSDMRQLAQEHHRSKKGQKMGVKMIDTPLAKKSQSAHLMVTSLSYRISPKNKTKIDLNSAGFWMLIKNN